MSRPPFPPFTAETAAQKVRGAEDAWNGRNPAKVALAYTPNRPEFLNGRAEIEAFLTRKMKRRIASINDLAIEAGERKFHRPQGRRPDDHPGLSALGL